MFLYLIKPNKSIDSTNIKISYTFYIKNYSNADLSNLIKTCEDWLVEWWIIIDDRYITEFDCKKIKVKNYEDEKIEINIIDLK
jgi:Holliday junction resolvase RusA-like endonuclease